MKATTLRDLANRLGAELHDDGSDLATGFATDSGRVTPGDLFIAIRGARVDGHDFVASAIASGAVAALVERPVDAPHLLVRDVVEALAHMAASFRTSFSGPVVGITGSAGKTTTKEFVAAALSPLGPVLKTHGNRNTEFTAPLLWPDVEDAHRAVVVEMAMRGFGQIRHLARFSQPTIGLVTNVGHAHLELVGSREGIAQAKGELLEGLPEDGLAVIWHEDEFRDVLRAKSKAPVRTFGVNAGADCRVTGYRVLDWDRCAVTGKLNEKIWSVELPAVGRHMALNAAAAVLVASSLGVAPKDAAQALCAVALPPMRMQITQFRGARILLDTYNASPASMAAALETISELPVAGRRIAVLGEMRELGEHREEAHRELGRLLGQSAVDEAVLVGDSVELVRIEAVRAGFDPDLIKVAGSIEDVQAFLASVSANDAVLIKGSRALELERAIQ